MNEIQFLLELQKTKKSYKWHVAGNKIRGVASSARLGVSANMRQLESFSFLAGGYNRAVGSILADLLHGGLS